MKIKLLFFSLLLLCFACTPPADQSSADGKKGDTTGEAKSDNGSTAVETEEDFNWNPENFADIKMVRYRIGGFDKLSLKQKKLVYYLTQAGLAGRDIMWDQNYRHNLSIRRTFESIIKNYKGDKKSEDWNALMLYAKRMFFSSGIHHHYGNDKFEPTFSKDYFVKVLESSNTKLSDDIVDLIFDPTVDAKKINFDEGADLVQGSAINFYDPDITEAEVDAFIESLKVKGDKEPISYGLNSKIIRGADGKLAEKVWSANGMYAPAMKEMIKWLEKAVSVAENEAQGNAMKLLIEYYQTGDLKKWDEYNIAWLQATDGDIDYITGFVEVYQDPKGYKGSFETIVQIKDFEASARMEKVAASAQWFEDNSPTMKAHKKEKVVGISYKVVNVAGESGDASPSTPIGVNLPNADWIRAKHGSKSVSLGNIVAGYANADGPGLLKEFAHDAEEIEMAEKHGKLAGKIHTALHEVVGHASGKLETDVATPKETLKSYASPLEEARADLVALHYMMDDKMVEMGLMESLDVGKAAYDNYIRNGLMLQLRRIEPGKNIQQAHMRNRQMIANWVYTKGKADNVIELVVRDGKSYFEIKDYAKLHALFGKLLREVQRIKSQGDYEAGKALIEDYGVQVDRKIHAEVLKRSEVLNIPPYGGFLNPKLTPTKDADGNITDIEVTYPDDFIQQMLEYGEQYSFLPENN